MIQVIDAFLGILALYLILGLAFSIYFYARGASKIDEGTKGTPWHFKLIILPGVVLLWPSLFIKLFKRHD
ncbi:hypothetical protein [Ekhidna sp.]|uniref:hypothetical protein n=1 Tax=Ekhidna sp. TaxID=2608089 RepID=UPI003BAA754D